MKELETYDPVYDEIIEVYAGLLFLYEKLWIQFNEEGCKVSELTFNSKGIEVERKSEIYKTLENLRKDIATYSDKLCLNPKTNNVEIKKNGGGGFEAMIKNIL